MDTSAPQIRMQCPKCGKSFPMDASYCDDCSAMLEPVEQETPVEAAPGPAPAAPAAEEAPSPPAGITPERMEDVALDTLKADVELKFISTLLLERDQATKRLEKKGPGAGPEADALQKKIARLETTLDRLTEKIQADVGSLEDQISGLSRPGPAGRFSSSGRYYRMLSSELKTKRSLLQMLISRRPPSFPTFIRLRAVLIPLAIIVVLSVSGLAVYWHLAGRRPAPQAAAQPVDRQPSLVTEREIMQLLDDIRKANLSKDLSLWESRYASSYLAQPGKREGIREQWAKVDYRSLAYAVDEMKAGPAGASALVTWTMEVISKADGMQKTVVQQLRADFVREGGVLKIASVRKQ